MGIVYREMLPAPPPGPPRRLLRDGEIPRRPGPENRPKPIPEEALASAERQADALLFQADEAFARSLGIKLTPLTPLELACHILGGPAPPSVRGSITE